MEFTVQFDNGLQKRW